jgi:hypothetical protein
LAVVVVIDRFDGVDATWSVDQSDLFRREDEVP